MNTGTPIYSQLDGTIVASSSGVLGFRTTAGNIVYLLHGYCVGAFCTVGQTVHIGDELITSACVPPSGGSCSGPRLHFEVHTSIVGELSVTTGPGDDINPEPWFSPQLSPVSPAGPVIGAFTSSELIVAPGSGSNVGMKVARNNTLSNPYGWSSFGAFNPSSVTFSGTPTAIAYSTYVVVFAIGSDGGLWIWYYDSGTNPCPNSAWCTAHALGGQLSQSSGIAAVSHTNILQVFAIGSNGSMQEYADSSPTCSNGSLYPAYNSWCNPAPIPGATTPLSLTSRVAVTEYAGYMQVFAVDVNGAMEHYAGACQGNDGWCTPYPLSNIGILTLSTSSGVAVVAYSGYMQLFALSYSGYLEEFSGACTPPPGQPYKVFCEGGALPGVLLSTNSGVAALVFGTHMQVFAIEPNGLLDEYSGACPPGPNGYQGWCPPFNNGGQLKPASDLGEMIWNGSLQIFALGSDSSIEYWSGTGGQTPDNCDGVGDGSNGWCNPKSLGSPFSAV